MHSQFIEKWTSYIKDCKARLDKFDQILHCPFQYLDVFQSMPKKFPNHRNISAFALYLGSYASYDLYSNIANDSEFYYGIYVFGDEDHEYGSGNFVSLLDTSGHFDVHNEIFIREMVCSLVPDKIKIQILECSLSNRMQTSHMHALKVIR